MLYNAPFGSADPDAPYVDRNTPGAVVGSKIPASVPNWLQREVVDVIIKAGFTPAATLQLALAIQSGKLNYGVAGGTASALTITLSPPPLSLGAGFVAVVKAASACTGTTTINVNGLGAIPLLSSAGENLVPGAYQAGNYLTVIFSGTDARIMSGAVPITTPLAGVYATAQGVTPGADTPSLLGTFSSAFGASAGSTFTFSKSGTYAIAGELICTLSVAGTTNGAAVIRIQKNGFDITGAYAQDSLYMNTGGPGSGGFSIAASAVIQAAAGDTLQFLGRPQASSGAVSATFDNFKWSVQQLSV